jgi:hypothetical protein
MDALAVLEAGLPPDSEDNKNDGTVSLTDSPPEAENKFQKAIAAWRGNNTL